MSEFKFKIGDRVFAEGETHIGTIIHRQEKIGARQQNTYLIEVIRYDTNSRFTKTEDALNPAFMKYENKVYDYDDELVRPLKTGDKLKTIDDFFFYGGEWFTVSSTMLIARGYPSDTYAYFVKDGSGNELLGCVRKQHINIAETNRHLLGRGSLFSKKTTPNMPTI